MFIGQIIQVAPFRSFCHITGRRHFKVLSLLSKLEIPFSVTSSQHVQLCTHNIRLFFLSCLRGGFGAQTG